MWLLFAPMAKCNRIWELCLFFRALKQALFPLLCMDTQNGILRALILGCLLATILRIGFALPVIAGNTVELDLVLIPVGVKVRQFRQFTLFSAEFGCFVRSIGAFL